jgi:hypothetical protein
MASTTPGSGPGLASASPPRHADGGDAGIAVKKEKRCMRGDDQRRGTAGSCVVI